MNTLSDLQGSHWEGSAELWLDPMGDKVQRSDCTLSIDAGSIEVGSIDAGSIEAGSIEVGSIESSAVRYTWSYEGKAQKGLITLHDAGADFTDSWHQPEPMKCASVPGARGLFQVQGVYGPESAWGWRIGLFLRTPTDELILQMTNLAPWGEETRAVRMTGARRS